MLLIGVVAVIVVGVLALAGYAFLVPYKGYSQDVFIELEHGTGTKQLAASLEQRGVIRSRYAFLIWRALHPSAPLQAGEYHFDKRLTPGDVFEKIRRGEIYYEQLVVPEGSNIFDIAELLKSLRSPEPDAFIRAARNPQLIHDLDPTAPDLEGYLFPASYRVTRKTTAAQLCQLMTEEFRRNWAKLTGGETGADVHKTVTLASLVEKETAVPTERPIIAAVFSNRIRLNMALQCDPTVVYAALRNNRYRGTIFRSDLASGDPYNTYIHLGLPPGPIANPGIASLRAALQPAEVGYLYFVARPGATGHHQFSTTLSEHEVAVQQFRHQH
jgi:UPF0755 protein